MPVVGCPKCKKKYKLSKEMLGKTVRCSDCQTKFKTSAGDKPKTGDAEKATRGKQRKKKPAAAGDKSKGASEASLQDVGLSGKMNPQFDLFSQPIPDKRAGDPLGNHALEDPGFNQSHIDDDDEDDDDDDVNDDMKQLLANPALKSLAAAKAMKKPSRTMAKPSDFKEIRLLGYVTLGFGGIAILCCVISLIVACLELFQLYSPDTELIGEGAVFFAAIATYVSWGAMGIAFILSVIYWSMAHANTSALGAKGQSYSPMWMAVSWFIPLLNLIWPMQGVSEIFKASKKPTSKKWMKSKGLLWESPVWTIAVLAAPAFFYLCYRYSANANASAFTAQLFKVLGILMVTLSIVCITSLIVRVTKAQYNNFDD